MHEDEYWTPQAPPQQFPSVRPSIAPCASRGARTHGRCSHGVRRWPDARRVRGGDGALGRWWRHSPLPARDRHFQSRSGVLPDRGRRGRDRLHPEGLLTFKPGTFDVVNCLAETFDGVEERTEIQLQAEAGRASSTGATARSPPRTSSTPTSASPASRSRTSTRRTRVTGRRSKRSRSTGKYTGTIILKERFAPLLHSTLPSGSGLVLSKKALLKLGQQGHRRSSDRHWAVRVHQVDAQAEGHPHEVSRLCR